MTARGVELATPLRRLAAYWVTTGVIVTEALAGGVADLLHLDPFYPVLTQLGYPPYLAGILGTAKVLAGVVVLAPGLPRLKEWAYAGIMVNMVGAAASQMAVGNGPGDYLPPLLIGAVALASWVLRPPARRLPGPKERT